MPIPQGPFHQSRNTSRLGDGLLPATSTSTSILSSKITESDDICSMVDGAHYQDISTRSRSFDCLSLWILNPSLRFSTNTAWAESENGSLTSSLVTEGKTGTPAMKIFWQAVALEAAEELVGSSGVEELFLPTEAICETKTCLGLSNAFLPPSARKFQNWEVGLLELYEE